MRIGKWTWICLAALMMGQVCLAADESSSLDDRLAQLEKEIAELKKAPASAPAAAADSKKKGLFSSVDVQLYGYLKADVSRDSSRATTGNYVLYVDSEATRRNDAESNMTANESRLGLNFTGPSSDSLKTSGKLEFDFFGSAPENKATLLIRHAYMNLEWPEAQLSLLAGQTWDVISPLNPSTLNYSVLWVGGNIGYRRPQVRLTKDLSVTDKVKVKLEGALSRTIGRTTPAPVSSETGEDAGFPTLQGRVSATFPFFGPKPTTIGISGHSGREEYDIDVSGTNETLKSQSINLDVTQPICKWMTLKAELFSGKDLDSYLGGINQGVNTTTYKSIDSEGGWVAASLGPWGKWSSSIGYGADNVDRDDVAAGTGRTRNCCLFGNVRYDVNAHAQIGLELSRWETNYRGAGDAKDTRVQASFIYKF
ncbi:MAG: hypothetical protein RBS72_05080 [Sedimentisphaerales bacterium]|nr:hypothetical protein [Sedimentisphaerales bacterium]HNY77458.1 hypothetical protein [Sedimentisphaerales bacterium]HOC62862.1 hypothetical protein [Sedimentisphaerales bacterium]HOH63652.1 hypothetical protein [Sedimentisphaerales bacterium]HPY49449.1 hypothetical protein [Sedimentisphaerales bacterium]